MMLYVFHVDVGRMMSFDMNCALSSVENLKDTIERLHGIPASNIVLLVSGGEMLLPHVQVSYYSAGTDTNPIYMFLTGNVRGPPSIPPSEPNLDLAEQVERSLELTDSLDTVEKRARLALRMYEVAKEEDKLCERFVHEQHLQQQGWYAVVANMEDLTNEFRSRVHNFYAAFDHHFEKRSKYLQLLQTFKEDLTKLSRIPILPGLMSLAEADFHGFDNILDTDDVFSNNNQNDTVLIANEKKKLTILDEANQDESISSSLPYSSTTPNKKAKISSESDTEKTILPPLAEVTNDNINTANSTSQSTGSSSTSSRKLNNLNLLQWITSKENHNCLNAMSEECIQALGTLKEETYENLKKDVQNIIKLAEQNEVKEIKGLGDRLSKLEEFKYKIKGMVKDQKELSTAFQQNQNRAINLGDTSILPDLCASHCAQLRVMLANHQKIREHKRLISKAKDELGNNLHARLKHIVCIENNMSELDNRFLFYHRCLKRAERHVNIIEQIHQTPCMYVAAVTEVVRRRIFSGEFRQWASKLSEDFTSFHNEEISRRQLFNASFDGHFLNILFPGMNDMPPTFANDNSLMFDTGLPNLTRSDIDVLTSQLPDLLNQIILPDMEPVINFFITRSGDPQNNKRIEELLKQQVANVLNVETSSIGDKPIKQHQRLSDLQREAASAGGEKVGCEESETDTETEFEQLPAASTQTTVATSTSENIQLTIETITRSTITEPLLTQSVSTLTDDNECSAAAEVKRLRALLNSMSKISMDCLRMAQTTMSNLRSDTQNHCEYIQSKLRLLDSRWNSMQNEFQQKEANLLELNENKSKEIEKLNEIVAKNNVDLDLLSQKLNDMDSFRIKCATMETQIEELNDKLKSAQDDQECAINAAKQELIHEHKTEIESLRCRFKLMTSMERSPSDTSLEKIERPSSTSNDNFIYNNFIEIAQHEAILAQQKANFEIEKEKAIETILAQQKANFQDEKEKAIEEALEIERSLWKSKISPLNSDSVIANVNIFKDLLEEKERQLDVLRDRERILTAENSQLKTRLVALTHDEGNSWLKEKIEYLNSAKSRLEEELTNEKKRRLEIETSFAGLKSSTNEPNVLTRSKSGSSSQRFIAVDSCSKGDIVFVVWSVKHGQFVALQDSQILYFVHGDSLTALNLHLPIQTEGIAPDEVPMPLPYYAIGRVVEKEYCQAKKDENRYRVSRGTKFYRIKLETLHSRLSSRREYVSSYPSSTSRSISQSESQSEMAALSTVGKVRLSAATTVPISNQSAITTKPSALITNSNINIKNRDTVDSTVATNPLPNSSNIIPSITTTTTTSGGSQIALTQFKERTMSITSVTEEDDEPLSLRSDLGRYTSVSEEDEFVSTTNLISMPTEGIVSSCGTDDVSATVKDVNIDLSATNIMTSSIVATISSRPSSTAPSVAMSLSTSSATLTSSEDKVSTSNASETVITEQPTATATKELKLQLMLASADIVSHSMPQLQMQQQKDTISSTIEETQRASSSSSLPDLSDILPEPDTLSCQDITSTTTTTTTALPLTTSNLDNNLTLTTINPTDSTNNLTESDGKSAAALDSTRNSVTGANSSAAKNLPLDNIAAINNGNTIVGSFCSASIPTSIGTSEDSDEYRSLEGKDEADFPSLE